VSICCPIGHIAANVIGLVLLVKSAIKANANSVVNKV
jgi:hypothetical protein